MLCLGITLNIKVINKKPKNAKNMALNRLWQGLCSLRAGAWKQCVTLSTSAGTRTPGNWNLSLLCTRLWMTMKAPKLLTPRLQVSFSEYVNVQILNPWIMRINYMGWEINTYPDFFFFYKLLQGNQTADEKKVFYITEFRVINAGGMTVTFVTIEIMYTGNSHQWLLKPLSARLVGNSPYYVWMWLSTQESTD